MRILVLTVNYWPEETGIGPITTWRCEYLASRGHQVTVCTTLPYYPEWRVAKRYKRTLWRHESRNGVNILRSWSWIPKHVSSAKRIVFEASFLIGNAIAALSTGRPDLLLVESPPLGLALTAWFLKRFWGISFVYDVMDLQPDAAADLGMLRDGVLLRALYRLEKFAYHQAAVVSTLNEGMRKRIHQKAIASDKVTLFAPRADSALLQLNRETGGETFRRKWGLEGKFVVLHAGNIGVKQGLGVILSAAQLSRDCADIIYLIVGDGVARRGLEAQALTLDLSNVKFLPLQQREQFFQMLAAADVCLITQQRAVADILFPSKTATYMAAGCPVIASVNPTSAVAGILTQANAGIVAAPEDPRALLQAIASLQSDSLSRKAMSEAGRRYARERWDESVVLAKMESELLAVLGSDSNREKESLSVLDLERKAQ
jgi:colanic acid biosynthesis glycosyl transferase WcaI